MYDMEFAVVFARKGYTLLIYLSTNSLCFEAISNKSISMQSNFRNNLCSASSNFSTDFSLTLCS